MSKKIKYIVWSGEGELGTKETKYATEIGIKRIITRERCGGDRWCVAIPADAPDTTASSPFAI